MADAAPILKWAGGKRQLLPTLLPHVPPRIRAYYEPFVGGGALFFALANERRFERAVLNDANEELVNLYRVVRSRVGELIDVLRLCHYSEREYYEIRYSSPTDAIARAARTVYLNRCGFNGLYRVNRRGEFNVPFGRYTNPTICNEPVLRAASDALQDVELLTGDFDKAIAGAEPGDFVYLDPPYLPVSATSSFAQYQRAGFGPDEHRRLALSCGRLRESGVPFVLSNSDTPLARLIFDGMPLVSVSARRNINSAGGKRGAVGEVLVVGNAGAQS